MVLRLHLYVFRSAVATVPSKRNSNFIFTEFRQRQGGCAAVLAQTPWRTAANYSNISTRRHITVSPVGKVPNRLRLRQSIFICPIKQLKKTCKWQCSRTGQWN